MANINISYEVHFRDQFGRFAAVLDEAAVRSVKEGTAKLEDLAQEYAPSGPARRDYGRRPKLRTSIRGVLASSRHGIVYSDAGHALAQEEGAGAHPIETTWPYGHEHTIEHPGNAGRHYLQRAVRAVLPIFMTILDKNYPG